MQNSIVREDAIVQSGEPSLRVETDRIRLLRFFAVRPYLELVRPPNLWTAVADIFAGSAVSGLTHSPSLLFLSIATIGLYGGGIVLNDVFDARLDRIERPERPIPSGRASIRGAICLAALLLCVGIGAAFAVGPPSGLLAIGIAFASLLYNAGGKAFSLIGPINMGLCRALNFLLGVSTLPAALLRFWPLALIHLTYIAGITLLSKGEVHGEKKNRVLLSGTLIVTVFVLLIALAFSTPPGSLWTLCFLALLAIRLLPRFRQAYRSRDAQSIRNAVKEGVLSIIFLDAAIAAAFVGPLFPLLILSFRPLASRLAKRMAVT